MGMAYRELLLFAAKIMFGGSITTAIGLKYLQSVGAIIL
jgi:hypothetical protein